MARVFTDGAELGDLLFWETPGSISVVTSQKRSGSYAYYVSGTSQSGTKNLPSALSEFYYRLPVRIDNIAAGRLIEWRSSTTVLGSLKVSALGKLELYVGTAASPSATGTTALQNDTWYMIEVHVKIADSGGILEVKVDGDAVEASFSGDTKPGTATTVDNIEHYGSGAVWYDDLALNDTSGGVDDSWPGDGHVAWLPPNANGDASEWTGSDGNQVDNYALVDEIPAVTSDYVEDSTLDHRDLYNLAACGLTNVDILRVWAEARAIDTVAEGGEVALVIKTESTEYDGPDVALLTSYTRQVLGTVHTTNPNTAAAWTTAQLDALQVGPKTR